MKTKLITYSVFLIILLVSCYPDRFTLNLKTENRIIGYIMSKDLESVVPINDNEILIYEDGQASLRVPGLTQVLADFTVNIVKGDGISFAFRTVQHRFEEHPSLIFNYTTSGCTVEENGIILTTVDSIKANIKSPTRVKIKNDGIYYTITVDCDTVCMSKTKLKATEYIIVTPKPNSTVILSGILFDNIIKESEITGTLREEYKY